MLCSIVGHKPVKNFYGKVFRVSSFNIQCMDGTEEAMVEEKCSRCGEHYAVGRTYLPARIAEDRLRLRLKSVRDEVMKLGERL